MQRIVNYFVTLSPTRYSPLGHEGQNIIGKGRLRTLSSVTESRKFKARKKRNRNVRVGCIVSYFYFMDISTIYLGVGYLELLILGKAMREPSDGISEK